MKRRVGRVAWDLRAAIVVGALAVGSFLSPPQASAAPVGPFPSEETFVQQQFDDLAGRGVRPDEYVLWVGRLERGEVTPEVFIQRLLGSTRSKGVVFPVVRLYDAYFGRAPDSGGLASWVGLIRSGTPVAAVSDAFARSPEFSATYGALTNQQFIARIYANVLGRADDPEGAAFWTDLLDRGVLTRGQVMLGFSESREFVGERKHHVQVIATYAGLLRRTPQTAELADGVDLLSGAPLTQLISQILGSRQYESRIASLCDPSYLDFCLPAPQPDLNCGQGPLVGRVDFRVVGTDPHDLDGDEDGLGCEQKTTASAVEIRMETFVDHSRPTDAADGTPVADRRTLETLVLLPRRNPGPLPLVVFGHGYADSGAAFAPLLRRWAAAGYVVAAPTYPTTTEGAAGGPDLRGYVEQPRDVSFVLDQLLWLEGDRRSPLYGRLDEDRIAVGGHSLGAVTTYGLSYNSCCRDPRVDALVPIAGHEVPFPDGRYDYWSDLPALFVFGDADPNYVNGLAVYGRAPRSKFLLTLHGAEHRPFGGRWDATIDDVVIAFLDAYLKGRDDGLARMRHAAVPGVSTLDAQPRGA